MQYHHLASSWFLLQTGKKSVASQIEVNPNHWLLEPSLVATGVVVRWKWYQMGVRHINHYWATYLIFFFFLSLQWTSTEGLQSTLTYPEVVGQQNFSIVESPQNLRRKRVWLRKTTHIGRSGSGASLTGIIYLALYSLSTCSDGVFL